MLQARCEDSVLAVIDFQPSFMKAIPGVESALARAIFLVRAAALLEVPILVTEQYATRMGGSHPDLLAALPAGTKTFDKMAFSAFGSEEFLAELEATNRPQVILVGMETHICVNQTAHDLIESGYEVLLAADAISGRGQDAHDSAMRRMVQAGAVEAHTESIVYEWMETAEHPQFKAVLGLVKEG